MINFKPVIANALKKVSTNVSNQYPKDWAKFPAIQYTEEQNTTHIKTDNMEQYAQLRYRIDVWCKDESTTAAVQAVDDALSGMGLLRTFCADVPDSSGLMHKVMRYECIVDKDMEYIFN